MPRDEGLSRPVFNDTGWADEAQQRMRKLTFLQNIFRYSLQCYVYTDSSPERRTSRILKQVMQACRVFKLRLLACQGQPLALRCGACDATSQYFKRDSRQIQRYVKMLSNASRLSTYEPPNSPKSCLISNLWEAFLLSTVNLPQPRFFRRA